MLTQVFKVTVYLNLSIRIQKRYQFAMAKRPYLQNFLPHSILRPIHELIL